MRLMLLAALLALIVWLLLARPTPEDLRRYMKRGALLAVAGLLILAAVTGRLHWLFALIGSLLPFAGRLLTLLRFLPLFNTLRAQFQQQRSAQGPAPGRRSQVNTRFLRMTLDHDSGEMDGEVIAGAHAGARLSQLTLAQLRALHAELAGDEQSEALLRAYLERTHGDDWDAGSSGGRAGAAAGDADLTRSEALEILGLEDGATRADVIDAHRRLMQKLHPDRGGSTYLAAKINRAKATLLKEAA